MLLTILRRWSRCCSYFVWLGLYTTGRFMFSLALLFVLVFFSPFSIVITSFGEERAALCASCAFICIFCTRYVLSIFSSSWYQGLAAACGCGTRWTFLFTFFFISNYRSYHLCIITVWDHVVSLYSLSLICIVEIALSLRQTIQSKCVFNRLLIMFWTLASQ